MPSTFSVGQWSVAGLLLIGVAAAVAHYASGPTRVPELKSRAVSPTIPSAQSRAPTQEPTAPAREKGAVPNAANSPVNGVPDDPALPYVQQAVAFRDAGHFPRAISALQQAVKLGRYNEDVHYTLGSWMELYSTPQEMIDYWSEELKTDQKPQTALYFWAVGLDRANDQPQALAKLEQALATDPAHEMSELYMAKILDRQGKHAEALKHCQTSVAILPTFSRGHEFCAQILVEMGRKADADKETELARSTAKQPPRSAFYWAKYLAGKGRTEAALAEVHRALAADPTDAEAWALLKTLNARSASEPAAK